MATYSISAPNWRKHTGTNNSLVTPIWRKLRLTTRTSASATKGVDSSRLSLMHIPRLHTRTQMQLQRSSLCVRPRQAILAVVRAHLQVALVTQTQDPQVTIQPRQLQVQPLAQLQAAQAEEGDHKKWDYLIEMMDWKTDTAAQKTARPQTWS